MQGSIKRFVEWLGRNWPIVGLCAALVLPIFAVSPYRIFWNDELYTYYFVSADSLGQVWSAYNDAINNTPFVYFGSTWIWAKVFGAGELSLRLVTGLAFAASAAVLWPMVKRYFGFWPASFAVVGVIATSTELMLQNFEARMYGLFLLEIVLATVMYDRFVSRPHHSGRLAVANAVVIALIVNTHLFGLLFVASFCLSLLLHDVLVSRPSIWAALTIRRGYYLSTAVGAAAFLIYLPAFLQQSEAGRPTSWIPLPTLHDLLAVLSLEEGDFVHPLLFVGFAGFVIARLAGWQITGARATPGRPSGHLIVLAVVLAFLLPIGVWILSYVYRPLFIPKYLTPVVVGWIIISAVLAERCLGISDRASVPEHETKRWYGLSGNTLAVAGVMALLLFRGIAVPLHLQARFTADQEIIPLRVPEGEFDDLPIVYQRSQDFFQQHFYSENPEQQFFILDPEAAQTSASGLFGQQEQKHMAAWLRQFPGIFAEHIVPSEEFLSRHSAFLVLTYDNYLVECPVEVPLGLKMVDRWWMIHCARWVATRIAGNPDWKITELDPALLSSTRAIRWKNQHYTVLLVERTSAAGDPAIEADANGPLPQS